MQTYYLVKFGLVLHLMGITMMVGTTVASFAVHRQLWKYLYKEKDKALLIVQAAKRFPLLQVIGGLLIIAGGATMMSAFHGVVVEQLWFKIKLALLLLIILNPVIVLRPAAKKLREFFMDTQTLEMTNPREVKIIKQRMNFFHSLQLLFFLVIFILSAFRFG